MSGEPVIRPVEFYDENGVRQGNKVGLNPTLPASLSAVIATTESLSAAVDLAGMTLVGIIMPAAWTAAALTFQGSRDGVTYNNLYDDAGNEYTVQAAASRAIIVDPADFVAWRYLKVRSGAAASPVAQTREGGTTLILIVRPVA